MLDWPLLVITVFPSARATTIASLASPLSIIGGGGPRPEHSSFSDCAQRKRIYGGGPCSPGAHHVHSKPIASEMRRDWAGGQASYELGLGFYGPGLGRAWVCVCACARAAAAVPGSNYESPDVAPHWVWFPIGQPSERLIVFFRRFSFFRLLGPVRRRTKRVPYGDPGFCPSRSVRRTQRYF